MGKAEGAGENWHGHVTALTVSPDYRRLGLAATLMNFLEDISEKLVFYVWFKFVYQWWLFGGFQILIVIKTNFFRKRAYFVDLFVRVSNKVAIKMYSNLGYIVYRTVLEYYSGDPDEDAFGKWFVVYHADLNLFFVYMGRYEESTFSRC